MTNELEKQFFYTFGIEPNCQNTFINPSKCPFNEARECCDCVSFEYPQISDSILLELICIKNKELISVVQVRGKNLEELKSYILQMCIKSYTEYSNSSLPAFKELAYNFKHQVRTLFEEG